MAFGDSESTQLVFEARRQLQVMTHQQLADLIDSSLRTVQRNAHRGGLSRVEDCHLLIRALHAPNPALAAALAASVGTTLEALNLVAAPAAVRAPQVAPTSPVLPEPVPELPPRREQLDSIVVAAADSLDLPPKTVRPALAAALARARELGVSVEALADAFAETLTAKTSPRPARAASGRSADRSGEGPARKALGNRR